MSYCQDSKSEYEEGVEKCSTCGTALLPGSVPQDHVKLGEIATVCVRRFRGPTAVMEAELARNVLEEEGIPCVLPGEVMAEVLPGVDIGRLGDLLPGRRLAAGTGPNAPRAGAVKPSIGSGEAASSDAPRSTGAAGRP